MKKKSFKLYIGSGLAAVFVLISSVVWKEGVEPYIKTARAAFSTMVSESQNDLGKMDLAVFSKDGSVLAYLEDTGVVTVRSMISNQVVWTHSDPKNEALTGVTLNSSASILASFGSSAITLWDVQTGQQLGSLNLTNTSKMLKAVFSQDGDLLAGLNTDGDVTLWKLSTGVSKWLPASQEGKASKVGFTSEGKYLVTVIGGHEPSIRLWDASSGLLSRTLPVNAEVVDVAFGAVSKDMISAEKGGVVKVWDYANGVVKKQLNIQQDIIQIAYSQDSKTFATASVGLESRVQLWDTVTGEQKFSKALPNGVVNSDIFYSPDGKSLASVASDNLVRLWGVSDGAGQTALQGQSSLIAKAAFNANKPTFASIGADGNIIEWDLLTGSEIRSNFVALFTPVLENIKSDLTTSAQVAGNSATTTTNLATVPSLASAVGIRNQINTRHTHRQRNWLGTKTLAVTKDGSELGVSDADGRLHIFNNLKHKERWNVVGHHGKAVTGLAYASGAKQWVSVGADTEIKIWDSATGNNIKTFFGPEHPLRTVAISPDGRYIAASGEDTRVLVYDVTASKLAKIFSGHKDFVNSLAFSPDSKTLASAGSEGKTLLWDVASGTLNKTLLGHASDVNSVAVSPDGATVSTASEDNTVIVWDINTGNQLRKLIGHQAGVRSLAYSPDGAKLLTAGADSKMLIWNTNTGQMTGQVTGQNSTVNSVAYDGAGKIYSADENSEIEKYDGSGIKTDSYILPTTSSQVSKLHDDSLDVAAKKKSNSFEHDSYITNLANTLIEWLVPSANAALPDPNLGPGGPILVITQGTPSFGNFYAEILRNEGLNEFSVANINSVTSATLNGFDVVILADMPITATQSSMFNTWVTNGGNLIAMHPDKQLAGLMGLSDAGATLSDGYLLINTSSAPGTGIVGETIQYHGIADKYTLLSGSGSVAVATLYNNVSTATTNPAVSLRNVGSGRAAAFTYDLAKSIVYSRQGNPLWATQERDGSSPIRSDDKFFGNAAGDPQPDWVDLTKATIPQADEQQRLLVNLILTMNSNKKPLPRFWYFPRGLKAAVIMTGDDHGNGGSIGRFDSFLSSSPAGCSVQNWECIRGTTYMYPTTLMTSVQANTYTSQGFEVGLHINTNCGDYTPTSLADFYTQQITAFNSAFPGIKLDSQRHHCIAWSDWATAAKVQLSKGMRLDTTYYYWPSSWILDRPGFFTGSGMPMRFADLDGSYVDVYQSTSQMTDESGQSYPFTVNNLLDRALGSEGYYAALTINAHTDVGVIPESTLTVSSAQSRGVPVVTARQMLNWLDFRNSSSFSGIAWSGNTMTFTVNAGTSVVSAANVPSSGLRILVPFKSSAGVLNSIRSGATTIAFTTLTVKGVDYGAFDAISGTYQALYAADIIRPTVISTSPLANTTGVNISSVVSATFSETVDVSTINNTTFILRDVNNNAVAATVKYSPNTRTATLLPSSALAPSTKYTVTLLGGAVNPVIRDLVGNALSGNVSWSFTTGTQPCSTSSCSAWTSTAVPATPSVNDPNSVELGVKFTSDINGWITGIRFYQTNIGTSFPATLWDNATQQQLATGTVTSTTSGWQQVNFSSPVAITAGKTYLASYHAPGGNYAANSAFFSSGPLDNPPIHLLQDGASGPNGVFLYSAATTYPTDTFQAANYWVDVVFSTNIGTDTTKPVVATTVPGNTATGVSPTNPITVVFNEAMDTATMVATNFELRNGANQLVSTSVAYNSGNNTATLTPSAALTSSANYSVKVLASVKDLAGNTLAGNQADGSYQWSFTTGTDPCATGSNPITCENSKAGNPASEWDIAGAGDLSIQGFTTDISVNKGQTVSFKIDTAASQYRLDIYRMGYYGGKGARLVASVAPTASLPQAQPACLKDATGLMDCGNWGVSATWAVPSTVTSGIYFAKAVRTDGTTGSSHIFFVVRDDASTSDIVFQTSDTTWQAYNNYGGSSFYGGTGPGTGGNSDGRAYKLSYNRPFNTRNVDGGQDWVFNAEYPMVRFLEANGYNVSYITGIDSDRFGNLIRNHKIFVSTGHDEYWSAKQRANVEAARDATTNPVNLAFFSGNEVFWKTRWENSIDGSGATYRTLVCYKETHNFPNNTDPTANWTGTWRDPRALSLNPPKDGGRPENALMGPIFMVNDGATTSVQVPDSDGKMRFWRGTSIANLTTGSTATLPAGTLGYEWDVDLDNGFRPAGLVRLSTTIVPNAPVLVDNGSTFGTGTANHALTLYKAASGAMVFGAGTVQWSWGLDNNHDRTVVPINTAMQQATINLFADMKVQPGTLMSGLSVTTASTDTTAPVSAISTPANGVTVTPGSVVNITGTASDTGGLVGGVEVSVDNGATWHPATGRANWSYAWTTPTANGQVTIKSRAVDDSLNLQTTTTSVVVNVGTGADITAPSVPSSLAAISPSSTQVNLTWTASTDNVGVTGYRIERCQGASCVNFAQIAVTTTATTGFADTALLAGTTYQYRIRATDAAGNLSGFSNVATVVTLAAGDTTPPTVPSTLTAISPSSTQVNLAWTASTDNVGVTGYRIERCQVAGCVNFAQIAATTTTTTSFSDSGLLAGTTYQYRIRATDAAGNLSGFSNVASVVTLVAGDTSSPTVPSTLTAISPSSTQVNLAWTASTDNVGVTGYRIERCQVAGCVNFAQIAATTTTTTSFSDTGLLAGTTYQYRVRANDAAGNLSGYSSVVSVTTQTSGGGIGTGTGLSGVYFATNNLTGNVVLQRIEAVNYNWGTGSPATNVPADNFSVRWTGLIEAPITGSYQFQTNSDDGVRVWVNNTLVIDNWTVHSATLNTSGVLSATAGQRYSIVAEYQEFGGSALIQLSWKTPGSTTFTPVPATSLYTVLPPSNAVVCANENLTCALPTGSTATVWYGANSSWVSKTGITGNVACSNATFGDPLPGFGKACKYVVTSTGGDTIAPTAPGNLAGSSPSNTQINLSWTASTDNIGVTGYKIERCQGVGCTNFTQIAALAIQTNYVDNGLLSGTTYQYRVRSVDGVGNLSSYSSIVSVTTLGSIVSTGFLNPLATAPVTINSGDNNGYELNSANATADGLVYASDMNSGRDTTNSCSSTGKDRHIFGNYGINVPAGAAIKGIQVRVDSWVDSLNSFIFLFFPVANNPTMCVEVSWNGGINWMPVKTTGLLSTSQKTYVLGSTTDTWGRTWSANDLTNTNFRVRITDVASGSGANDRDFFLDWVSVQVTYQ